MTNGGGPHPSTVSKKKPAAPKGKAKGAKKAKRPQKTKQ